MLNTDPRRRALVLFCCSGLLLMAASPARAADPVPSEPPRLATIVLVRHAEKAGSSGNVPLSHAGRARAQRLAAVLRDARVQRIFTSEMTRTRDTAAPLAAAARIAPEVVPADEVDELVGKLRTLPSGAVALVVHHSNSIPEIVEKLGGPRLPPIAEMEFDRLLVLTRTADGTTRALTLRY